MFLLNILLDVVYKQLRYILTWCNCILLQTKYQDVKLLIKGECNINDFILDNLLNDTEHSKKVRVGLADNAEGYKVMKCLDGYRIQGNHVLKVVPVGKSAVSVQSSKLNSDIKSKSCFIHVLLSLGCELSLIVLQFKWIFKIYQINSI